LNVKMKRLCFLVCLSMLASLSVADWTAKLLQPASVSYSEGVGAFGAKQAGTVYLPSGDETAAVWSGTTSYVSLQPSGGFYSYCYSAAGTQQVGYCSFGGGNHACVWNGTAASFVDLAPAGAITSYAMGAYGTKQVGYVYSGTNDHAVLWSGSAASMVDLHPAGAAQSLAYGGGGTHQVGEAQIGGVYQAVMWSGTAASMVNLNPSGSSTSRATAATDTKQVGFATLSNVKHAGFWTGSAASFVDLHPAGSPASECLGAMDKYQVGDFYSGNAPHACVWTGTAASMVDLHAKLPANYSRSVANSMSTDGVKEYIVGTARNGTTNKDEAVMWSRLVPALDYTFVLNKASVAGQNSVQGTITLSATQTTATVFTTYDNSSLVTTPATVTVAANTILKNFQITVTAVTSPINTIIYAKLGATIKSQLLTLAPLVPTALSFTPNPVIGGHSTVGKVVINGVAGPGGRTIALVDNSSYATTPSTVVVPAGASSMTFTITTKAVPAVQNVTVTARVTAGEKAGTFRINP
jgi:hypothetical protein